MAAQSAQKRVPSATDIPDRLYFRIGDVARICDVETHVLRFWETQFPNLKPNKGGTGQRLYKRREVELALRIKQLVHEEGYTLAGARQAMEGAQRPRLTQSGTTGAGKAQSKTPGTSLKAGQGQLSLSNDLAQKRLDSATAVIGQIRAELRDLAHQLAVQEPTVHRRRSRLTAFKAPVEPLFPL